MFSIGYTPNFNLGSSFYDNIERLAEAPLQSKKLEIEILMTLGNIYQSEFVGRKPIIDYMGAYFNALNLRYASVSKSSEVKISCLLSGLIRNDSPKMEPYITENLLPNSESIKTAETLEAFAQHMQGNFKDLVYDVCILLTARELKGSLTNPEVKYWGMSYGFGACHPQKRYLIIREQPQSYGSVGTFVHELTHALGVRHDGATNRIEFADSPSGMDCPGKKFLMATSGKKTTKFSSCSIKQLEYYVQKSQLNCLKRKGNKVHVKTQTLPGELLSKEQMCQKLHPTKQNVQVVLTGPCTLQCYFVRNNALTTKYQPEIKTLDGHVCGQNMICWHGDCISQDVKFNFLRGDQFDLNNIGAPGKLKTFPIKDTYAKLTYQNSFIPGNFGPQSRGAFGIFPNQNSYDLTNYQNSFGSIPIVNRNDFGNFPNQFNNFGEISNRNRPTFAGFAPYYENFNHYG